MFSQFLSRIIILLLGNLYPAYASFKAVKSKNAREYARWMMYWIVFAIFTVGETFTDVLLSWFPFYYEFKVAFVIWLLLPTFKGSSFIYRKLLHPYLIKNEKEIDLYIEKSKEIGSQALVTLGRQGIDAAQRTIAQRGPLWRTVSAQYLDQIVSNREIDYNRDDDSNQVITSSSSRVNSGGVGIAGPRGEMRPRLSSSEQAAEHRPTIRSSHTVSASSLRHRSGSYGQLLPTAACPVNPFFESTLASNHSIDYNNHHHYYHQSQDEATDFNIDQTLEVDNDFTYISTNTLNSDPPYVFPSEPHGYNGGRTLRGGHGGVHTTDDINKTPTAKSTDSVANNKSRQAQVNNPQSYIRKKTQPIVTRNVNNSRPGR